MALVRRNMDLTPTGPAVNTMFFKDFLKCPPDFFHVAENAFRHNPQRVNVCEQSEYRAALFPDSMGKCLKVSTKNELQNLTQRLLSLPIFFTVDLRRSHKSPGSNIRYINREAVAVVVNTQHEYIQNHIKGLLAEAMACMEEGKNFAVEFDFNGVMEEWLRSIYIQIGEEGSFLSTRYSSKHGKFTVTNCGEYSQVFSCKNCPFAFWCWFCCLPCCLLTCPIYKLQRSLRVTDLGGSVMGVIATYFKPYGEVSNVEDVIRMALTIHYQQQMAGAVQSCPPQPSGPPVYAAAIPQPINGPPAYTPSVPQQGNINQPGGPYEQPAQVMYGHNSSLI